MPSIPHKYRTIDLEPTCTKAVLHPRPVRKKVVIEQPVLSE